MAEKVFIIRFDADSLIGSGHANRCRALGESLRRQGFEVIYACKYGIDVLEKILDRRTTPYVVIPQDVPWANEAEYLFRNASQQATTVVLDISTLYAFEDLEGIKIYMKRLGERCRLAMIDGLGDNALLTKVKARVDFLIVPYFGAQGPEHDAKNERVNLMGPQYFIFGQEYETAAMAKRPINPVAEKILVTLGGADPYGVTLKVLAALELIKDKRLSLRVVIGPHFDKRLKEGIVNFKDQSLHDCEVIREPSSLLEHMLWCDMAITSSGLTKYELAITGTPSLQVSFNKDYARVNDFFAQKGCAKHLGVCDSVPERDLFREIQGLMEDRPLRRSMSQKGRRLLDGGGVGRVIDVLRRAL